MSAAESVLALVSGLPRNVRGCRPFMVLQAYVDDSGSDGEGPIFVLAGFLGTADDWISFSDEWAEALAEPPSLGYFKAAEANRLRDQFDRKRGWNERLRDDRVASLIRVIKKHAIARMHVSMRHRDFEEHIKNLSAPARRLSSDFPYTLMFMQIVLSNAIWMADNSHLYEMHGATDFVFDEQLGFSDEALQWWPNFKRVLDQASKTDLPQYVGSSPIFRDEKRFLPLQAADLLAWLIRRQESRSSTLWVPTRWELRQFEHMPGFGRHLSTSELRQVHERMLSIGERFRSENPDIPFYTAEEWAARPKGRRRAPKPSSHPSGSEAAA